MSEKIEIWKSLDFLGYPDYEVSNMGQVKSLNYRRTGKEKILKPTKNKDGYLYVNLYQTKKVKHFFIHRLVAITFILNPFHLHYVNHKDENKANNHVSNLEFCSAKENCNYGTRNERIGKKLSEIRKGKQFSEEHKRKISIANKGKGTKPIQQYTKQGIFVRDWDSITTVNIELKINSGQICECCKGNRKSAGGYIWRYK